MESELVDYLARTSADLGVASTERSHVLWMLYAVLCGTVLWVRSGRPHFRAARACLHPCRPPSRPPAGRRVRHRSIRRQRRWPSPACACMRACVRACVRVRACVDVCVHVRSCGWDVRGADWRVCARVHAPVRGTVRRCSKKAVRIACKGCVGNQSCCAVVVNHLDFALVGCELPRDVHAGDCAARCGVCNGQRHGTLRLELAFLHDASAAYRKRSAACAWDVACCFWHPRSRHC